MSKENGRKDGRGVQSVEIGGQFLRVLASSSEPMMLRDLAAVVGLPAGQAHPYLVSFRKLNLIEQDAQTGLYRIGSAALRLAATRLMSTEPFAKVWVAAAELANLTGMAVTMSVWSQLGPMVARVCEGDRSISSSLRPGSLYALDETATGRLFAAFSDWESVRTTLERQFDEAEKLHRVISFDWDTYRRRLDVIRQEGFSYTQGHPTPGISGLSAPVFDGSGEICAALTLVGRESDLRGGPGETHRESLMQIVQQLTMPPV